MLHSFIVILFNILILFLILHNTYSAKYCYSGQNSRYTQKQCSSGSLVYNNSIYNNSNIEYVCHKYSCEGGRCMFTPFVLRTCAPKVSSCFAGSRICLFSKGKGKCDVCKDDFCNE
ncbi:hypothetical protein Mgra_00000280 [Meloidogyne graminicola]|uniref:Uncharacterized protein n=1 Tax=Meloidogyne graminicola TaxID=189291 RepID=A0A8T0A569_9BILA|nr:hypothetical protein Mgra_00000280 [Meloidogyne graminicola]